MEGQPTHVPPISSAATAGPSPGFLPHMSYPESIDSSPRSRNADSPDELQLPAVPGAKLRLMCSYGGHIVPRPHDKSLCYVGGDTRIVVVDRYTSFSDILTRLSKILLNGRPFTLKYQLPNEDLDSLVTVSTDEDLENMVDEYDRLNANSNPEKPSRIRLFLFPTKPEAAASVGSILDESNNSDEWFLDALNGARVLQRGFSDPTSVNCLLGLEENVDNSANSDLNSKDPDGHADGGKKLGNNQSNPDVQSVPDSPIIGTSSSFGSTSSSPSLSNLPPIRVHVEDGGSTGGYGGGRVLDQRIGIQERFSQMGLGVQKRDDGFVVMPPPTGPPNVVAGEYLSRVVADDESSDHGVPIGYRKPSEPIPSQTQQKQIGGELSSPDSVSSDSSLLNAISRQTPFIYQEQIARISAISDRVSTNFAGSKVNFSDPNIRVQMPQNLESRYALASQYDLQQQQLLQQQQQQLLQQQQQQQQQQLLQQQQQQQQEVQHQPQPQPQQFIHGGPHFVHHPSGVVPLSTYYHLYPSQQTQLHPHQLDQRYPVYYIPAAQAQAYSLPPQQPNFSEAANPVPLNRPQTPPNPTMITTPAAYNPTRNLQPRTKPEVDSAAYRPAAATAPPLVQVPSGQPQQQQFMGYAPIHHPPQTTGSYAYEFADPAQTQLYFTQPLQPASANQFQNMTSVPKMVLPDASTQLPSDTVKQQIRSSQPL
ncbi:hypothetical protein Nepgr_017040 [Nepenthes gracilis]|uniref:PB1 domain-containing protein n=1 Tax=Nepenthes gracilis TaxID=150966 RepID=A0AAD3SQU6_NEPGR|nr:hypothetical protein Nepgr_017040 [Nepenthes gracilis]